MNTYIHDTKVYYSTIFINYLHHKLIDFNNNLFKINDIFN